MIVVVTDYAKIRYAAAGNTRLRVYCDGSVRLQSADMSLSREMADEDQLPFDVLQQHEERGNLYAYLRQERGFNPYISKKFKLVNADSLLLYTCGAWGNIDFIHCTAYAYTANCFIVSDPRDPALPRRG